MSRAFQSWKAGMELMRCGEQDRTRSCRRSPTCGTCWDAGSECITVACFPSSRRCVEGFVVSPRVAADFCSTDRRAALRTRSSQGSLCDRDVRHGPFPPLFLPLQLVDVLLCRESTCLQSASSSPERGSTMGGRSVTCCLASSALFLSSSLGLSLTFLVS